MPKFKPYAQLLQNGKWAARNLWQRDTGDAIEESIESFEPEFDTEAEAVNFARLRGLNAGEIMQ